MFGRAGGEVVNAPPDVRGAYGWVKVRNVADRKAKMAEHGTTRHGMLIHDAEVADALELFGRFLGIEAVGGA